MYEQLQTRCHGYGDEEWPFSGMGPTQNSTNNSANVQIITV